MRRIRISKVRVTDYRPPPGAGLVSPLERKGATRGGSVGKTGLDFLAERQELEQAQHDQNIREYTPGMLPAVFDDVCRRIAAFPCFGLTKDQGHELRWLKQRKAALLRLGRSMRERGLA